jgi:hypothetical protein
MWYHTRRCGYQRVVGSVNEGRKFLGNVSIHDAAVWKTEVFIIDTARALISQEKPNSRFLHLHRRSEEFSCLYSLRNQSETIFTSFCV